MLYCIIALIVLFICAKRWLAPVLKKKWEEKKRSEFVSINNQCDCTENRANVIALEIIESMEALEAMPNIPAEEKSRLMQKYDAILQDAISVKDDVEQIRGKFSLEECVNV